VSSYSHTYLTNITVYRDNALARSEGSYGRGSGPIFVDDVVCDGTEVNILQCGSRPLGTNNCDHSEDAGVVCSIGE
jgi:hypothetical protein